MYPWLASRWADLRGGLDALPPGLMFVGPSGLGKFALARATAAAWLCPQAVDGDACGRCSNCDALAKGLHPDLHLVTSGQHARLLGDADAIAASRYLEADTGRKPRQVISVSQVRSLIEHLVTHAHGSSGRVALVVPASDLNHNAANALLKILEEPPGDTRFLLVGSSRDAVPATVVSRVAMVECHPPSAEQATAWLQEQGVPADQATLLLALASGAPLTAWRLYEDGVVDKAGQWRAQLRELVCGRLLPVPMAAAIGVDAAGFLPWLEKLLCDVLRVSFGRDPAGTLVGTDAADEEMRKRLISRPLWDIIEKLAVYRAHQQRAIDEQLFLEDVLIAVWQKD